MNTTTPHPREDEAVAYAFGLMEAADRIPFVNAMNHDDSLRALVDELQQTAAAATLVTTQTNPPAAVRARVLESIKAIPQDGVRRAPSIVTPTVVRRAPAWVGWAAGLALLGAASLLWVDRAAQKRDAAATMAQLRNATAMAEKAQRIAADAIEQAKTLSARLADAEKASSELRGQLASSSKANADLQQRFTDTVKATEVLKQQLAERIKAAEELKVELAALTNANKTAKMQIAMLESTVKEYKQGVAVVVWNAEKKEGILKLEKMPPIQSGKDYNLWVIDSTQKTPVNAGIVRVDDKGFAKVDFKPTMDIQQADKFALSVEKQGGAPAGSGPEGPVVLIGQ